MDRKKLLETYTDVFQTWIRWRDDWKCITCGTRIFNNRTLLHAGHYYTRGNIGIKFDEVNVNGQCSRCNEFEHLNEQEGKGIYRQALIRKYGLEEIEELDQRRFGYGKIPTWRVKELIKEKRKEIKDYKLRSKVV